MFLIHKVFRQGEGKSSLYERTERLTVVDNTLFPFHPELDCTGRRDLLQFDYLPQRREINLLF